MKTIDLSHDADIFMESILKMSDKDLLSVYKQRSDYQPLFIEMVENTLTLKGYDLANADLEHIDAEVIKKKTTEELVEIFTNATDYAIGFSELAETELLTRGYDVSSLLVERTDNKKVLKAGRPGRYITVGYIIAFLGGLLALIMGINYACAKYTSVSGEKFPKYDTATRKHGKRILVLAIASTIFQLIAYAKSY